MAFLRPSSSPRRLAVALGSALGIGVSVVAPLLGACSCDPGTPMTEGCDGPITDFSGIESVEIVDAHAVNGIQGGQHFQFQIYATGTGLGECVGQTSSVTIDGMELASSITAVRADVGDRELRTRPVIVFPRRLDGIGRLHVEALGRVLEVDVSLDPFSAPLDAAAPPDAPDTYIPPDMGFFFFEDDAPITDDAPIAEDAP